MSAVKFIGPVEAGVPVIAPVLELSIRGLGSDPGPIEYV
jgi:hypothetical protein